MKAGWFQEPFFRAKYFTPSLDYGKGYKYAHDFEEKVTAMQCLPDSLKDRQYYNPTEQGNEGRFKARYEQLKEWKENHRK